MVVRSLREHPVRWALIVLSLWAFVMPTVSRSGRDLLAALFVWAIVAMIVWCWDR